MFRFATAWLVAILFGGISATGAAAQTAEECRLVASEPRCTEERCALFRSAAEVAWSQFDRLWNPRTGLARATPEYDRLTPWDIGSVLGATYSARILELIDEAAYQRRMERTLSTLVGLGLYRGAAYNKLYSSGGALMGRNERPSRTGYSVSATDLGRLLVWLHIIAENDSTNRPRALRAAGRIEFDSVVSAGYLYGEERMANGRRRRFQEGRIGYEQYAAAGFAAHGAAVERAADLMLNARPVTVAGVDLLADARGLDRLTSEPFILLGLELGWTDGMALLAQAVLLAQEKRTSETGRMTILSEDAVSVPPHYFYYGCVYCSGQPFVVEGATPGNAVRGPRWVSTKASFGWHALLPGDFTRQAVEHVAPARDPRRGWASGVHENSGRSTDTYDVNTAAVILEAAAYVHLDGPLVTWRQPPAHCAADTARNGAPRLR